MKTKVNGTTLNIISHENHLIDRIYFNGVKIELNEEQKGLLAYEYDMRKEEEVEIAILKNETKWRRNELYLFILLIIPIFIILVLSLK